MDTDDRVQCHACGRVWPRRLHDSLECPHCGSDFTEIVCIPNLTLFNELYSRAQIEIPPDTDPEPELSHPDPPETFPGHRSPSPPPVNPWTDHNPWARMDPGRDNGMHGWDGGPGYRYTQRTYRSPGGNLQFSFSAHSMPHRRVPGVQRGMGSGPAMDGLDSFFHGISELNRETAGINRERAARGHEPRSPFDDMYGAGNRTGHNQPHTGLFPRDADGPQPMDNPLRSLSDILQLFQSNLANTQTGPGGPHVRVVTGGGAPIGQLISTLLSMRSGDAVYSQEELDRIISQLAEQNGDRTAAPPASQDAIHALPKKAVTKDMLGGVESTECSICMDTVKVDDQVTVLPCTHWFHPQCIEMWLGQHNTCPHCRRAIDPTTEEATTTAPSEGNPNQTRRSDSFSRSSAHPSFDEEQGPSSRTSRGEGSGSWAGWVRSRLGGGD